MSRPSAGGFEDEFRSFVGTTILGAGEPSKMHYTQSADCLRRLMKEGPLKLTDLRDQPVRFFRAHSILSEWADQFGPGFGIRFTVQVNLFAGSILALGTAEQVAELESYQRSGALGCFALTEKLAGVHSGLVVNTTATWDDKECVFEINSGSVDAHKNWISQGLTADKCVVVASLKVGDKNHGAHAFLIDMRRDGKLVSGIELGDMGFKTIGNDLDNAWINFEKVRVPKSALLARFCDIVDGKYVQKTDKRPIDMIGQRLFTGRLVIAQSALIFAQTVFKKTRAYTDNKKCWAPKASPALSSIPQLKDLYLRADAEFARTERFLFACEGELAKCLLQESIPSPKLQEAIACAKVKAIAVAIDFTHELKQEVGSYALMGDTGFDKVDYLQCTKFAEGDSRILMQKLARDRLMAFQNAQDGTEEEVKICMELGAAMMSGGRQAWDENFRLVYGLAEAVIERTVNEWVPASKL